GDPRGGLARGLDRRDVGAHGRRRGRGLGRWHRVGSNFAWRVGRGVAMTERRAKRKAFWDDALNVPNALTIGRIVLIPVVRWFVGEGTPRGAMLASYMWAILAVTDFLDGFLARKFNIESLVGKFLDPLADKLLVMALSIYLVPMGRLPAWIVVVLLGRE